MSRPLTRSEAAAVLRRGAEIEQFMSLTSREIRYLTISPVAGHFVLTEHHVHDEGTDDLADLSEFQPVHDDEEVGEGRTVAVFADAEEAVAGAQSCGGSPDCWVNQATAAEDYLAAKRG